MCSACDQFCLRVRCSSLDIFAACLNAYALRSQTYMRPELRVSFQCVCVSFCVAAGLYCAAPRRRTQRTLTGPEHVGNFYFRIAVMPLCRACLCAFVCASHEHANTMKNDHNFHPCAPLHALCAFVCLVVMGPVRVVRGGSLGHRMLTLDLSRRSRKGKGAARCEKIKVDDYWIFGMFLIAPVML